MQVAGRRGVMASVGINLDEFLRIHCADAVKPADGSALSSHRLHGSYALSGSHRFLTSYATSYTTSYTTSYRFASSYRYVSSFTTSFGTSFRLASSFKSSFASSFADKIGSARMADAFKEDNGYIPVFGYGINFI